MKPHNIIGMKYGKLTVVSMFGRDKSGAVLWKCVCDCGNVKEKPVKESLLRNGKVKSCGCAHRGINNKTTHGASKTRLYRIWQAMRKRCGIKSQDAGLYYDRGISVCDEWKSFEKFRDWALSNGYSDNLSIDRIDNNKGYFPDNCRWATAEEQANNKRNTIFISVNGHKKTISEWSKITGIKYSTLLWRFHNKRNIEQIFKGAYSKLTEVISSDSILI